MYETKNMKKKKDRFEPIHIEAETVMPKYNAFACGYGVHEKSKKARNKANRKANKAMCKGEY